MDSMRSLNRSLPSSASSATAPSEQLLHAFKQAALSVTNLYKTSASNQETSRQIGYQDAIEDLLRFLDRENIGLQDGEGWRIREWATAQHKNGGIAASSDDEDEPEQDQRQRSNSPTANKVPEDSNISHTPVDPSTTTITTTTSSSSSSAVQPQPQQEPSQSRSIFQFQAGQDHAMQTDDAQSSAENNTTTSTHSSNPSRHDTPVRGARTIHKNNRHHNRPTRPTVQQAGSKRKVPFPDLSEIFSVGFDKKDGFDGGSGGGGGGGGGGSKRTRFV